MWKTGGWAVGGGSVGVLWPPVVAMGIHKTFDPTTPGELMAFMIPTPHSRTTQNLDPLSVPSYLISKLAFLFSLGSLLLLRPINILQLPISFSPCSPSLSISPSLYFPLFPLCLVCVCVVIKIFHSIFYSCWRSLRLFPSWSALQPQLGLSFFFWPFFHLACTRLALCPAIYFAEPADHTVSHFFQCVCASLFLLLFCCPLLRSAVSCTPDHPLSHPLTNPLTPPTCSVSLPRLQLHNFPLFWLALSRI